MKFTCQDPCNLVRKGLGDKAADDMRFVIKACAGDANFVDTWPNKSNNYCCGGGGGAHQAGFKDKKLAYGKFKFDQVARTDADVIITPCHNCHTQLEQLCEKYQGKYETWHLWDLIMKALVR